MVLRPVVQEVTLEEVLERAEALVPRLRERAAQTEKLRRVPDETVQDFLSAGLFRVLQPKHWGGFELNYGRTQTELCNVLGRACGSSAWLEMTPPVAGLMTSMILSCTEAQKVPSMNSR